MKKISTSMSLDELIVSFNSHTELVTAPGSKEVLDALKNAFNTLKKFKEHVDRFRVVHLYEHPQDARPFRILREHFTMQEEMPVVLFVDGRAYIQADGLDPDDDFKYYGYSHKTLQLTPGTCYVKSRAYVVEDGKEPTINAPCNPAPFMDVVSLFEDNELQSCVAHIDVPFTCPSAGIKMYPEVVLYNYEVYKQCRQHPTYYVKVLSHKATVSL